MRQALFSADVLREKQNSGVIELAPDTMLAVRVAAVEPAHVPPLDKVSETIRAKLLDERRPKPPVRPAKPRWPPTRPIRPPRPKVSPVR